MKNTLIYQLKNYAIIFETTQEPTVLPHSLIANLNHSCIAIGD
jgi:hypothetical protein